MDQPKKKEEPQQKEGLSSGAIIGITMITVIALVFLIICCVLLADLGTFGKVTKTIDDRI